MTTLVPNELIKLAAGRVVRVLAAGLGVVVRTPRGNRVGVRNAETGRLSYIHEDVLLRAKKAALSMAPEHTCIKSDGGTPGRRCRRCEQEAPASMPTIQVGDVVQTTFSDISRVETTHEEWAFNENSDLVVAIYRDPLWRRPQAETTKGDES